jgi:hypothetical protein
VEAGREPRAQCSKKPIRESDEIVQIVLPDEVEDRPTKSPRAYKSRFKRQSVAAIVRDRYSLGVSKVN